MILKENKFAIRNKFSLKANFTVFKNEFKNDIVLFKGSNGTNLHEVVKFLKQE
jgi:UDP-N-acetylmuramyl pentapeptide synthase